MAMTLEEFIKFASKISERREAIAVKGNSQYNDRMNRQTNYRFLCQVFFTFTSGGLHKMHTDP